MLQHKSSEETRRSSEIIVFTDWSLTTEKSWATWLDTPCLLGKARKAFPCNTSQQTFRRSKLPSAGRKFVVSITFMQILFVDRSMGRAMVDFSRPNSDSSADKNIWRSNYRPSATSGQSTTKIFYFPSHCSCKLLRHVVITKESKVEGVDSRLI